MNRAAILIGLSLGLIGCQQAAPIVYVDLSRVPVEMPAAIKSIELPSSPSEAKVTKTVAIEDRAARLVSVDRQHTAAAIRNLLESESAEARRVISDRLKQYYQSEIDDFFDNEYAALAPAAQAAWKEYRDKVRPIFEKYALERGPLVVALTVLTEFPNPEALVKKDPEADPAVQARTEKIRDLQRKIALLDQQYEIDMIKLDSETRTKIEGSETEMNARVEAKRKEINERAEREAKQQVSVRADVLNERLVGVGASKLPSHKGASLSVQLGAASNGFKGVPSTSRALVPAADVHRQLQMWLALNGFDLADSPSGGRDATQDFIKWRSSLTSKP